MQPWKKQRDAYWKYIVLIKSINIMRFIHIIVSVRITLILIIYIITHQLCITTWFKYFFLTLSQP